MSRRPSRVWMLACAALAVAATGARSEPPLESRRPYTEARVPCLAYDPLRVPLFGDLHVHTRLSLDASTQGTRTSPADAYRFARGERIEIQPFGADGRGLRSVELARPLDFAAVTDHAELLGEVDICNSPDLPGHDSFMCRIYRRWPRFAFFWMNLQASRAVRHDFCGEDGSLCRNAAAAPWQEIRDAAETYYDRTASCELTTFAAYEWTGGAGPGNNFHRNVIFRGAAVPSLPTSFIDAPTLPELYADLDADCRSSETGCEVIVIPHNSNLGGGEMFQTVRPDGTPITADDARTRASYERLAEVMQHKGESECHPSFSTEDELCGFEKLSMDDFRGRYWSALASPPVARQFLRHTLQEGLRQEARLGANPFEFGLIASTDTHLGAPGLARESADYPGHGGAGTPAGDSLPAGLPDAYDFNPGGLAVVWAEENSRDAIFDALWRREVYGTSGTRILVRFFGGFELPGDLCEVPGLAARAYATGVPMGGSLPAQEPTGEGRTSPAFAVSALRDPGGAGTPLQRVQIVKGWLAGDTLHEQVFDIAGDANNGATVDARTCEPEGPGSDALCTVWRDPRFDPAQRAFYYARVVENPTCRWSQKLCNARGVRCDDPATLREGLEDCCAEDHEPVIQERAWTSPIWYRPEPGPDA